MPRSKKRPYDATFRFRGYSELGARIARVIEARGHGDDSDIMREGVIKHVIEQERALGLHAAEHPDSAYGAAARNVAKVEKLAPKVTRANKKAARSAKKRAA